MKSPLAGGAVALAAVLCLVPFARVHARVASVTEVPLVIRELDRETRVSADGAVTERWKWRIKVQRDEAREDIGSRSIRFYKNFEEVRILRAGTRRAGRFQAVDLKDLQERAVTDENPGFSSLHEFMLSFPDVQEGSEIEYEYEISAKKALEPGFWGQSFEIDSGAYEDFRWRIVSEKDLTSDLIDPTGRMTMRKSAEGGRTVVTFTAKAPFSLALADEVDPFVSGERKMLLMAGFLKDWSGYGRSSARDFESRARESASAEDEAFAKGLRREKDPAIRIQKILQRIARKFRYFGDWRTTEQMYVPRRLGEIYRTLYGDCKDFALVGVRLFRLAGLEAKPVWILNTEERPAEAMYRFPTDNAFNHVIVRVTEGEREWWVDPTNPVARVRYLADEIAGRPGLVLDENGSRLLPIRKIVAGDYVTGVDAEVSESGDGKVRVAIATKYEGFSPVSAGEQLKSDGLSFFVEEHLQKLMPSASLTSVRATDIDVESASGDFRRFEAVGAFENFWVRTSSGPGFSPVREDIVERLRNLKLGDRGGDVLLGKVYTYRENVLLKGYRLQGPFALDCDVRSPWIDFTQRIADGAAGVRFQSSFELKEAEMILSAANKPAVLKLQKDLRECAGRILVLLRPER